MGKPLISDAQMRSMHQIVARLRHQHEQARTSGQFDRATRSRMAAFPDALLAALLVQLEDGDSVVTQAVHPLLEMELQTIPVWSASAEHRSTASDSGAEQTAMLAAGIALRQKTEVNSGDLSSVTVALLHDVSGLQSALEICSAHTPPLLIVSCGTEDVMQPKASSRAKRSRQAQVPAIPVDANDAVAVCRVLQESLLRARQGWSSVWIKAIRMPGESDGMLRLEEHLRQRGLLQN